jgi:hypothetical protein
MAKQNFGGVYANMEFKPYEWQEYPKHITTGPHGKYEIVNNLEEEEKVLAVLQKQYDETPGVFVPFVADHAKEVLISRARELGVPFNSLWSKTKMEKVIAEAEAAVDDLPPEETEPKKPATVDKTTKEFKDKLLAEAKSLGIPAVHVWGVPRLENAIAEARAQKEE